MSLDLKEINYFINQINSESLEDLNKNPRLLAMLDYFGIETIVCKTFTDSIEDYSENLYAGKVDKNLNRINISRKITDSKTATVSFYVSKDINNTDEFDICINAIVHRIIEDILKKEFFRAYSFDRQTGLPNHNSLQRHVEGLINSGRIHEYTAGYLNIKKCSSITKIFGSDVADEIFNRFSHIASSYFNSQDGEIFARLGGDNFVFIILKDHENEVIQKLHKINVNYKNGRYSIDYDIETRMGLSQLDSSCLRFTPILASVTSAVSIARTTPSDIYFARHANIDKIYSDEFELSKQLHTALEKRQFLVYYQPIVDCDSNIVYAEALVRWRTTQGMISPSTFIPVAEKSDLIGRIDLYVLETVCSKIIEWKESGYTPVPIHCNFSTTDLTNTSLPSIITSIVDKYGVDHNLITIEFNEDAFHQDASLFLHAVSELSKNNFNVAIHNFGAGYASITPLQKLNINALKLGSSLLNSTDPKAQIVVDGIIDTSNKLGLYVIAEGANEPELIEHLKNAGCKYFQSEYFGKPVSERFFANKLSKT